MRKGTPPPYVSALTLAMVLTVASLASAGWVAGAPQDQDAQGGKKVEHPNEVALIIAGTYEDEETNFTTGLEFERRLPHRLGVGAAFEYLADGTWLFVVPLYFHPVGGFKVFTGPGVERKDGENLFLWRVGVAYVFEFAERYFVSPGLEVDFVGREEALVFGANFGISF